jgi:phytoene synthase
MAAAPDRFVRRLTRASRSNFYYSFLVLPRHKRAALFTIYAFCRHSDDLVDQAPSPAAAEAALAAWRRELDACFAGRPGHPITEDLRRMLARFPIPRAHFDDLLAGLEMDLRRSRYETFEELALYCRRVAGVVGLMCIEVFGYANARTRDYAEALGTAFQLTNILRDLGADARRGRIYLPLDELRGHGVSEADILAGRRTPALLDLLRFQAARAEGYFQRAAALLPGEDRRAMVAAEVMRAIYRRLLREITARDFRVFDETIGLGRATKLGLTLATVARCRWLPAR